MPNKSQDHKVVRAEGNKDYLNLNAAIAAFFGANDPSSYVNAAERVRELFDAALRADAAAMAGDEIVLRRRYSVAGSWGVPLQGTINTGQWLLNAFTLQEPGPAGIVNVINIRNKRTAWQEQWLEFDKTGKPLGFVEVANPVPTKGPLAKGATGFTLMRPIASFVYV
jgi:hypothetical protein